MADSTRDPTFDWLTVRPTDLEAPGQAVDLSPSSFWPSVVRWVALLLAASMVLGEFFRLFLA